MKVYIYRPGEVDVIAFTNAEKLVSHLVKENPEYRLYDGYGTQLHNVDPAYLIGGIKVRDHTAFYRGTHIIQVGVYRVQ